MAFTAFTPFPLHLVKFNHDYCFTRSYAEGRYLLPKQMRYQDALHPDLWGEAVDGPVV
jgi:hypothetical protein